MHIAARNGQLKMLQALLEEGGDPTQQSKVHVANYISLSYTIIIYQFLANNDANFFKKKPCKIFNYRTEKLLSMLLCGTVTWLYPKNS